MGTNYYLKKAPCPHCGHSVAQLHIGKSSTGWNFGLRIYPKTDSYPHLLLESWDIAQIIELDDWRPLFERFQIFDEYDRQVSPADMLACITERSHPKGLASRLTAGPELMGPYGHLSAGTEFAGKGTYDLINHEFS